MDSVLIAVAALVVGFVAGVVATWVFIVAKMERYRRAVQAYVDEVCEDHAEAIEQARAAVAEAMGELPPGAYDPNLNGGRGGYIV